MSAPERRLIGSGGFGEVYACEDSSGEVLAVKRLRATSSEALARFEREAALQRELSAGGGFVPVYRWGRDAEGPFLVMPYLAGGNLQDRLREGPPALDEALEWGIALARALGRAHARGVVHRDIKPENILFDDLDRPLLTDLGVARMREEEAGNLTRTGELVGTPGRMSPEQLDDPRKVGPATDVFALAGLLYEAIAGRPAFDLEGRPFEVAAAVCAGRFAPLRALNPRCPPELAELIEANLDPDPAAREPDGEAFAEALTRLRLGAPAARAEEPEPEDAPRALPALLVAGAAVLTLTLAAAALWPAPLTPREPKPPAPQAAPPAAPEEGPVETPLARDPVGPPPVGPPREALSLRLIGASDERGRGRCDGVAVAVALSLDGERVAGANSSGRLQVWSATSGALLFEVAEAPALSLCFLPRGELISGEKDGSVRLWGADGSPPRKLVSGRAPMTNAILTRGAVIVAGPTHIQGWTTDGRCAPLWSSPKGATLIASAPHSDALLAARGKTLTLLDASTGQVRESFELPPGHASQLGAIASPEGELVAALALSADATLRRLDLRSGEWSWERSVREGEASTPLRGLAVHPSGAWVLLGGAGGRLRLFETGSGALRKSLSPGVLGWIFDFAIDAERKRVAVCGYDGRVHLCDFEGRPIWRPRGPAGGCLDLHADAGGLVSLSTFGEVSAWSADGERLSGQRQAAPGLPQSSRGAVNGEVAATSLGDKRVVLRQHRGGDLVQSRTLEDEVLALTVQGRLATWINARGQLGRLDLEGRLSLTAPVTEQRGACIHAVPTGELLVGDVKGGILRLDAELRVRDGQVNSARPLSALHELDPERTAFVMEETFGVAWRGHEGWSISNRAGLVSASAIAPQRGLLAVVVEAELAVFNALTGELLAGLALPLGLEAVTALTFNEAATELFAGTRDGRILRVELR